VNMRIALDSIVLTLGTIFLCTLSVASEAHGKQRGPKSDTEKGRITRIENGIEPIRLGKGEAPLKLSLEKLIELYNAPGLTVVVIREYKLAWAKAYGVTAPRGQTPVTTKTLFQAGSISKPVTAMAMLKMVEEGKLSLDEDVNLKLKAWKVPDNEFTKEQKVTLRRLASHTAGLTVHGFPGYDVMDKLPTLVQVLNGEKPANTDPVQVAFPPGSKFQYSGGGVTIEQLLMTEVARKPFPVLLKETVFDRIGMKDSSYEQPLPKTWSVRAARGADASGKAIHGGWHIYPEMAAAGLWTTPTDLAKFAIEIALSKQGKSNRVLSQKTVQEMLTPVTEGAGLGLFLPEDRPGEFGHYGADEGFQAVLMMNADTGDGFVAMSNSDNGIYLAEEYMRAVRKEYGWKYQDATPRSSGQEMMLIAKLRGVDAALKKYEEAKSLGDPKKVPDEYVLISVGNDFLKSAKTDDAIKIFERNVQEHPHSSEVYASLADGYAAAGKKKLAMENYEKSLKIDPKNRHAKDELKKLTEGNW
jgi:CubicO group peptidase (beta-lactamase class C family)